MLDADTIDAENLVTRLILLQVVLMEATRRPNPQAFLDLMHGQAAEALLALEFPENRTAADIKKMRRIMQESARRFFNHGKVILKRNRQQNESEG